MAHPLSEHGLSRPQAVTALPEAGLDVSIEAKPAERESLANYLAIPAVNAVSARLTLRRWRASGLQIQGTIHAKLVQTCVVTLEPMATEVRANIDRKFLPAAMLGNEVAVHELIVDPDGEDPPEPLTAIMNLGDIVVEELVLNLDPYPRSVAGGPVESGKDEEPKALESPFSVLKGLTGGPPKE